MNKAKLIYHSVKAYSSARIAHRAELRRLRTQILVLLREGERGFYMGQAIQNSLGRPVTQGPELLLTLALADLEAQARIVHFRTFCMAEGCYDLHDIWAAGDRFAHAGPAAATYARWDGRMPSLPARDGQADPAPTADGGQPPHEAGAQTTPTSSGPA